MRMRISAYVVLYRNICRDTGMALVVMKTKVIKTKTKDVLPAIRDFHCWVRERLARQLQNHLVKMIVVDV